MPFGVVRGVGRGMGVLDGVIIVEWEGAILEVNVGRPIVTNGTLLRRCVEVRRAIELSFGVVSGVVLGIHVLDGSPRALREGAVSGIVCGIFGICAHIRL